MYSKRSRFRALFLAATVVLSGTGCTGWRPEPGGLTAALKRQPSRIRITQADSVRLVVSAPRQVGDTLVGQATEVRIPTAAIARVETRGTDGAKTVALLGGIGLFVAAGVIAAQSAIENQLWQ